MLDMKSFYKIFEAPKLHSKNAPVADIVVSHKNKTDVYNAIDKLGLATANDVIAIVNTGRSSTLRCIVKLRQEGKIILESIKIIGKARVRYYKVTGLV